MQSVFLAQPPSVYPDILLHYQVDTNIIHGVKYLRSSSSAFEHQKLDCKNVWILDQKCCSQLVNGETVVSQVAPYAGLQ